MRPVPRWLPRALEAAAVLGAGGLAFLLRVVPLWSRVIGADVRLVETDAYFHARLVHSLVEQPTRMEFDPYALFPGGLDVRVGPLFDHLAALLARALGGRHPSEREVDLACALLPPLLAALLVVPVWAAARALGGRFAGLSAALLVATLPGELFVRSVLGFADHHVLEALTYAATLALLGRALATEAPRRAALGGALAGVALGAYLAGFASGALGVAVLALPCVADVIARHPRGGRAALAAIGPMLAVAALLLLACAARYGRAQSALALGAVAAAVTVVFALSIALGARPRRLLGLLAVPTLGALALLGWHLAPSAAADVRAHLGRFGAGAAAITVNEVNRLFYTGAKLDLQAGASQLGLGWLGLAAGVLWWLARVRDARARLQLLAALAIFVAAWHQRRFCYYLAVHAAIAGGCALGWLASRHRLAAVPALLALGVSTFTAVRADLALASGAAVLDDAWAEELAWLRRATPEPFGFPNAFLAVTRREGYRPPRTAYGVLAWWDYGYWIEAVGRRIPITNPTQAAAGDVARVLLERDPARAVELAEQLGARYLMLDRMLALGAPTWKLWAVARYAGGRYSDRWAYTQPAPGRRARPVYFAGYAESLVVRLFVFGGRAARPTDGPTLVARVAPRSDEPGEVMVVGLETLPTRAEAEALVRAHPDARLASLDPLRPVVPLEALPRFALVHESPSGRPPEVRTFELR